MEPNKADAQNPAMTSRSKSDATGAGSVSYDVRQECDQSLFYERYLHRFRFLILAWILAALNLVGAEESNWTTVFDEQFADNPVPRFKMLPVSRLGSHPSEGSGRYDEARHAYSLAGHLSLVRPVQAGAHVELDMALRFEPPGKDSAPDLESDLMLVLFDGSMAGIELLRSKQKDAPTIVKFVLQKSGPGQSKLLREIRMSGEAPDGVWRLSYRHGLLTLVQGTNTVGSADTENLGVSVMGVSWIQKGGAVTCQRMTLKGEPLREVPDADQKTLQQAARLNEEAKRLLRDKKTDEALVKMDEALALFLKVHGENHHDSANAFANRAYILESTGNRDEAGKLWAKALAIHEKTLGSTHPHTTLTRFNLGKNCFDQGDKAKAKELWTRCRDDWRAVLGPEYSLVKSLDSLLPGL